MTNQTYLNATFVHEKVYSKGGDEPKARDLETIDGSNGRVSVQEVIPEWLW